MQSFLETIHSVYIFYCKKLPLSENEFWQKLVEILDPLTRFTQFEPDVKAAVYDKQVKNFIEYENLNWPVPDINQIISANKEMPIEKFIVFYPSLRHCYENKITPDIFFKISAKPSDKEKRYDLSFMLVVKKDLLIKFSQKKFEDILHTLQKLLTPVFKIKQERKWAIPVSEFQYSDEMQFFFPSMLLDMSDRFALKDEYRNWIEF